MSDDLISREETLYEMATSAVYYFGIEEDKAAHDWAMGVVSKMPSAQHERTCVNCGKTVNNGGWYADGRTRCPIEEHYALPKDGYCHLWEKRNFTDDDYPERRTDEQ